MSFEDRLRSEGLQSIRERFEISAAQIAQMGALAPPLVIAEHRELERMVADREALVSAIPSLVAQFAQGLVTEAEKRLREEGVADGVPLQRDLRHIWQDTLDGAPATREQPVDSVAAAIDELGQVALVGEGGMGKSVELISATRALALGVDSVGVLPLPIDLRYVSQPEDIADELRRILDEHAPGLGNCLHELTIRYRCVLLLDGAEQFAPRGQALAERVGQLLAWIGPGPQIVLACRPESLPLNSRIATLKLEMLTPDEVCAALQARGVDPSQVSDDLRYLARTPFYLHELLRTPATSLRDLGSRPGDVLGRIARRHLQRGGVAGETLDTPEARLACGFALLVLELFGSGARWSNDLVDDEIVRSSSQTQESGTVVSSAKSVQEMLVRCGVLRSDRSGSLVVFTHELLQQHLAGLELCRGLRDMTASDRLALADEADAADGARASDRGWRVGLPHPSLTSHESAVLLSASSSTLGRRGLDELLRVNPLLAGRLIRDGQVGEDLTVEEVGELASVLRAICRDPQSSFRLRLAAGDTAAALAPLQLSNELLLEVPGGEFEIGTGSKDAFGSQGLVARVEVEPFRISQVPVTRAMFGEFVAEGGYDDHSLWDPAGWDLRLAEAARPWPHVECLDDPVTGVSLYEAEAFARWCGARLPTEHEWEIAASWADGERRRYPWGNEALDGAANVRTASMEVGRTTPVGMYSTGLSALGLSDMAGNTWEWCGSLYGEYAGSRGSGGRTIYPVRGGCFWSDLSSSANTSRLKRHAGYRLDVLGFRLASS
jgi:formylglycine-generating enzyme required for sulfatase activity